MKQERTALEVGSCREQTLTGMQTLSRMHIMSIQTILRSDQPQGETPTELTAVRTMSQELFDGCEVVTSLVDDGRFGEETYTLISVVCPEEMAEEVIVSKAVEWHSLLVAVAPQSAAGLFRLDVSAARK